MTRGLIITSLLLLSSFCVLPAQPDLNVTLLDHRNDFSDLQYTDVWGYVHASGEEYAVIGTRRGVAIYQIDLNGRLKLIQHVAGDYSPWRDMKSYGDYIYAIDDSGNDGLMVINMQQAPQAITWSFWRPELTIGNEQKFLNDCHNLWIDEKGRLYLAGCNLNRGGVLIADLAADPGQPTFIGAGEAIYSHDCYAADDLLWSADLSAASFSVSDVSDPARPVLLARQRTGGQFTHNIWPSDDNRYVFTTDEVANAAVESYDVQDLDNIKRLDAYRPAASLGSGVIPHNVHYYRGWLVISYYTDGVKIVDAHRPDNLVEVGSYDTWPGADGGYHGCWGAFPFLPSGRILASNIEDGLYVLQPAYKRACYLEGRATDAVSGAPLNNVRVEILSDQANVAFTDLTGEYKTGQFPNGVFDVLFVKEGYQRTRATVQLKNGEVTLLDVQLVPLKAYTIQGRIRDAATGAVVPDARVQLRNDLSSFETTADEEGRFSINGVYEEDYEVFAAAWGYRYRQIEQLTVDQTGPYVVEMQRGYQDDFLFDFGWQSDHDAGATAGFWEWREPRGTTDSGTAANPYDDLPDDFGDHCYVTGNRGGPPNRDDVDGGTVRLTSPPMDLTFYQDPLLSYHLWFFNSLENGDDTLQVFLSNGTERVLVEQLTDAVSGWRAPSQIRVLDFLPVSSEMYLILETADQPGSDHVVEAAFDGFMTLEGAASPTEDPLAPAQWRVFPNPATGPVTLEYRLTSKASTVEALVFSATGQLVFRQMLPAISVGQTTLPKTTVPGMYFIQLIVDGHFSPPQKIVWIP